MGGFVFDSRTPDGEEFIPGSPRLTLRAEGVRRLTKCSHLPDISASSIIDRSKTDYLGKTLVCVQAGWMIVQCITRVASHLPVTLLEINTLGHVLCALLIYLFWWHKPLDVRDPTVIAGEHARELCAPMYKCSEVSSEFSPAVPTTVPTTPLGRSQHSGIMALTSRTRTRIKDLQVYDLLISLELPRLTCRLF
jgi:hypothetical protein